MAPNDDLSKRLFFRLLQAANVMNSSLNSVLLDFEMTVQRASILATLASGRASDGMTVGSLAKYLRVSRQNITVILAQMEGSGHVQRIADSMDKRRKRVILTESGRACWNEVEPLTSSFYESVLSSFSRDDQVSFTHFLTKLLNKMESNTSIL